MTVAKTIELSADSPDGFEAAIRAGVAKAAETLRGISGAYVKDQVVVIEDDQVTVFRVHLQITFKLD